MSDSYDEHLAEGFDEADDAPGGSWEREQRRRNSRRRPDRRRDQQPYRPAGVRQPRDYQSPKKPAAQREAEGDAYVEVRFRGVAFRVLADPDDWPIEVIEAQQAGRTVESIRLLLGPRLWQKFRAKWSTVGDVRAFNDALNDAIGLGDEGN